MVRVVNQYGVGVTSTNTTLASDFILEVLCFPWEMIP